MNIVSKSSKVLGPLMLVALCMSGAASAAEAYAVPTSEKGASAYKVSVFVDAGEEGVSFTLDLPKGAASVNTKACGRESKNGVARCFYAKETGKLAVVLFRLDGRALDPIEYDLGRVEFATSNAKNLVPVQISSVTSASRSVGTHRESGSNTSAQ